MSKARRKLAAIMFTDMVGYTALGQKNESLSIALVGEQRKLIRPILNRHNGNEVKTIGDAFLVKFSSALDAVRCAYDVQRATREFNVSLPEDRRVHLRVGVHLGDIVESENDISGDAVNVASRVEAIAEDGGVLLTRQVYDHVQNTFELPMKSLGMKALRNVSVPVEVYKMVMPWDEAATGRHLDKSRIAVLPFANISPDPADEYFADGMTEELIDRLSQVRALKVIARTSVMGYKKREKKASEIGKELQVGTLLEGSVRKAGNKIRVSVQLLDAGTEEHLWSSRYDRRLDDVFAIQSEIAETVTSELQVHLVDSEKRLLERIPTRNTEAYMLYLKGRYYWNERTKPSVEKGIAYLQKAIQVDPNLALAYSDLADAYVVMAAYGMISAAASNDKIHEYATTALAIDSALSQPHNALASFQENNFRWADAETEHKLSIELNPNNPTAHQWYALHLFFRGKYESALDEWRKAKELDPISPIIDAGLGYALVRTGRREEGLDILKTIEEMDENFKIGHHTLALAYLVAGDKAQAVEEAKKVLTPNGEGYGANAANVASMYASAGLEEEAKAILNKLLKHKDTQYTDACDIAMIYAALGDESNALEWLEKGVNEKSGRVVRIKAWPFFDRFWISPRFKELLKQAGLG